MYPAIRRGTNLFVIPVSSGRGSGIVYPYNVSLIKTSQLEMLRGATDELFAGMTQWQSKFHSLFSPRHNHALRKMKGVKLSAAQLAILHKSWVKFDECKTKFMVSAEIFLDYLGTAYSEDALIASDLEIINVSWLTGNHGIVERLGEFKKSFSSQNQTLHNLSLLTSPSHGIYITPQAVSIVWDLMGATNIAVGSLYSHAGMVNDFRNLGQYLTVEQLLHMKVGGTLTAKSLR